MSDPHELEKQGIAALCVCGHSYAGHMHPSVAWRQGGSKTLPCYHEDGCVAFQDSGERREPDRAGHWPNMWELEDHNPS